MTNTTNLTPESLVARIKAGDTRAEHELVSRYSRSIMTMLTGRCADRVLAEDLHQDTFIIVLERLRGAGIKEPARLPGYIYRTAKFVWIAYMRKNKRRGLQYDTEHVETAPDGHDGPLEELLRNHSQDAVRKLIDDIKHDTYRQLLHRRYVQEQSKDETCEDLGMESRAYDRAISRARAKFREELKKSGDECQDGGSRK